MKWTAILATVVACAVPVAAAAPAVAHTHTTPPAHSASYGGDMRKARAIVNSMDPRVVDRFCSILNSGYEAGMTRASMYRSFRHGYGRSQHPSAIQVFTVLEGRCS
jgi:hypothetical protein